MKQKRVFLLCGCPASGKTTWAQNFLEESYNENYLITYISRDAIRFSLLKDGEDYFAHEDMVWWQFVEDCVTGIEDNDIIIIDQTNLHWPSRKKIIRTIEKKLAIKNTNIDYKIIPVVFRTPLETCLDRNDKREGRAKVPKDQLISMYNSFTYPETDPFHYNTIIHVYN